MKRIDTLFINGKIYTMKEEGDLVEALAVKEGRIVFAGNAADALAAFSPGKTIDLGEKTVFPGFGDSHLHLYAYCQNRATVSLDDVNSLEELTGRIREKAKRTEKGVWIKGTGFDQTKFPDPLMPTRHDLDRISKDHPIVIRRCCLHTVVANSLAMQRAGIGEDLTVVPEKLREMIGRYDDGTWNGVFLEKAAALFDDAMPNALSDPGEKRRAVSETLRDMASKGLTTVHTYSAKIWNYEESIELYRDLDREGALPLRITVSLDELFEPEEKPSSADPMQKVRYGSYKIYTDGSLGARSAALSEPYRDDPGNRGVALEQEKITEGLLKAFRLGLQPAVHAIGDRALDLTMNAIEAAVKEGPPSNRLPVRIIHAQLVRDDQIERLKRLPAVLDIQPVFLCTDLYWIESRLGKERSRKAYRWKTLMDSGLTLAGGSDCPVESYDPLKGIYAAVTRQDVNGFPQEGWLPSEKLSVYEAICLFTKNIARMTGDESLMGTLEAGRFADLTVLEEDPFQVSPERLKDIPVAMTFVAGEMFYCRTKEDGGFPLQRQGSTGAVPTQQQSSAGAVPTQQQSSAGDF